MEFETRIALRLYTIAYECKHKTIATLKGILSAEDAINRSAPTHVELELELNELFSVNLVEPVEDGYIVTAKGNSYFQRATNLDGNVFEQWDYLQKLLKEEIKERKQVNILSVDRTEFSQAYQSYYGGEYKF